MLPEIQVSKAAGRTADDGDEENHEPTANNNGADEVDEKSGRRLPTAGFVCFRQPDNGRDDLPDNGNARPYDGNDIEGPKNAHVISADSERGFVPVFLAPHHDQAHVNDPRLDKTHQSCPQ